MRCSRYGNGDRMHVIINGEPLEEVEVSGGRVRERPRLGWMDGVKVALGNRGMLVEAAYARKSGKPWYICN